MFLKKTLAVAILSVGAMSSANANQFEFSYDFGIGYIVTGAFSGTANGNLVTNLSDISVSINGIAFNGSGSLLKFSFTNPVNFTRQTGESVVSFDGTANNFGFSDSSMTNEFFDLTALVGSSKVGFHLKNQYGLYSSVYNGATNALLNNDVLQKSSNFYNITPIWSLKDITPQIVAVPEPESLTMMLLGLPMMVWSIRRRKTVFTA
jgi:hypothetical protein